MDNFAGEQESNGVFPSLVIPGGGFVVKTPARNLEPGGVVCTVGGATVPLSAARSNRIGARLPSVLDGGLLELELLNKDVSVHEGSIFVGELVCDNMHIVANPAVDPKTGSLIVTKSGSRGHQLAQTLFRVDDFGVSEIEVEILNPTGVGFDQEGVLYVTNRAEGTVIRIDRDDSSMTIATDLGVATGIAFSPDGTMYVGDRTGKIYRISSLGDARDFAELDSSVSAYHMAFDGEGSLYVTAPGLCSYDSIHKIDRDGEVSEFFRGLGRPQGLAFDPSGNLFVAACYRGRHGVVKISPDGLDASHVISGSGVVGLCFDREGNLLVATGDSVYKFPSELVP